MPLVARAPEAAILRVEMDMFPREDGRFDVHFEADTAAVDFALVRGAFIAAMNHLKDQIARQKECPFHPKFKEPTP